ncbi:MAG: hypothetical protein ACK5NG_10940 [Chthoniobacterales bacterium]
MFKQLFIDNWHGLAAIGIFALTFLCYIFLIRRAMKLKDKDAKHMSELPLDKD